MQETIKYYYYAIINTLNGKKYCGITTNPHNRIQHHLRELKNNCHHSIKLQNAVNKHGIANFKAKVLEEHEFSNVLDAYDYEQTFIAKHNSYLDGYNMTPGGLGSKSAESYAKTKESWWNRVESVYQIDKETYQILHVYPSLREAERQTGFGHANIGAVCHRTNISCYGFYWCFAKDWDEN